jgi:hypothetical protein
MSNILTDWRLALIAHLETNLQGGIFDVRSGERDEGLGSKDRPLAVVFTPTIKDAANILFSSPPMLIRAWLPQSTQPKATAPRDPGPLEQLAVDLMTTLEPVQASLLPGRLFFHVAEIAFDYVDWGVQATLSSFTGNPATGGA